MKMCIAAMAVVFLLTACTDGGAKKAVSSQLYDPDSAKFEGLTKGVEDYIVCGQVNAKNRMGGYVGARPFFYFKDSQLATLVSAPTTSDFRSYWYGLQAKSSDEDFEKVYRGCQNVTRWNQVCGNVAKIEPHKFCTPLMDPKGKMYEALSMEFGR